MAQVNQALTESRSRQPAAEPTERRMPRPEWNATRAEYPQRPAYQLFEEQVERSPEATAIVFGNEAVTYRDLNGQANRLAHYLRRRGVTADTLVGVSMSRSPRMVVALLGIWKAGGAYVPIDPTYPAERCTFMAEDADVHLLITDSHAGTLFSACRTPSLRLDEVWDEISLSPETNPVAVAGLGNLAYVIYTSGSTGRPKGALIEHRGLTNYLWWAIHEYGLGPGDLVPVHSSISFDLTVTSLYPALLSGGRAQLLAEDLGAQTLVSSLHQADVRGLIKITPAHLDLLARQVSPTAAAGVTRAFIIGGENLAAESLQFWRGLAPQIRLINEYGPTETVVGCCTYEVRTDDPQNGSVPIGRPIANTELHVLDERLNPVPIGETGELYVGGVGVGRGYLNRPELTRERFLPDTFSGRPGGKLYKTGDLARYRPDGVLEYLGRVDSQVKIRGYRVELGEIEATILGHESVRGAAVVVREISPGSPGLIAYVVPAGDASIDRHQLRAWLKAKLPEYMVPAHCVVLDELPLTHNGKVDRTALPALAGEPAPQAQAFAYIAPGNETEEFLVRLWAELLRLERIGVDDDVFDLGLTSLMVISAASKIEARLGEPVDLTILFENPTTRLLAAALKGKNASAAAGEGSGTAARARDGIHGGDPAAAGATIPAPRAGGHIVPVRFGPPGREILGLHHVSSAPAAAVGACLILNPFGQEAVRSHRLLRSLAEQMARLGFDVMRFDYHGTGDSPGDETEGGIERWTDDALAADKELRRRSRAGSHVWLGVRLGANIAERAARRAGGAVSRLVLWDPITDGAAYLAELARAHIAARRDLFGLRWETDEPLRAMVENETTREALGYPLPDTLKLDLSRLIAKRLADSKAKRVVLVSSRQSADARAASAFGLPSSDVKQMRSDIDWLANRMLADTVAHPDDVRMLLDLLTAGI